MASMKSDIKLSRETGTKEDGEDGVSGFEKFLVLGIIIAGIPFAFVVFWKDLIHLVFQAYSRKLLPENEPFMYFIYKTRVLLGPLWSSSSSSLSLTIVPDVDLIWRSLTFLTSVVCPKHNRSANFHLYASYLTESLIPTIRPSTRMIICTPFYLFFQFPHPASWIPVRSSPTSVFTNPIQTLPACKRTQAVQSIHEDVADSGWNAGHPCTEDDPCGGFDEEV
ncbi:hypothetical protein EV360DRAFT_81144 [Lentinula raphanica]|nr:hypothetical protein EV360DRAFT_81144 [Lentinula raphanica]